MDHLTVKFQEADVIICDYETRLALLKYRSFLPGHVKFLSKHEIKSRLFGETHYKAFAAILKETTLNYELANSYLAELPLAATSKATERTSLLSNLDELLRTNGHLKTDDLFLFEFKNKHVYVPKSAENDPELSYLLSLFTNKVTYFSFNEKKTLTVTHYENGYVEVYDILNEISGILKAGTPPEKINLLLLDRDYELIFRRLAPQFNLMFRDEQTPLLNYPIVYETYINFTKNESNLSEIVNGFLNEDLDDELFAFQSVLRKYDLNLFTPDAFLRFLKEKLRTTVFTKEKTNGLKIVRSLPLFSRDFIYFIPAFSQKYFPGHKKLVSVLSNHELSLLKKLTASETNKLHQEHLKDALFSNNVRLSFAPKLGSEQYKVSPLVEELKMNLEKAKIPQTMYSLAYANFYYGLKEDKARHYNQYDSSLSLLANSADKKRYLSYSHAFKPFKLTQDEVRLSYSKLNLYQRIPFDYFAQELLKLYDDEPPFHLTYGNFVHKVIELTQNMQMFDATFNEEFQKLKLSAKDKYTIRQEKELIRHAINFRLAYLKELGVKRVYQEEWIEVPLYGKHKFVGKVDDLIVFTKNKKDYAVVIDYKTGEKGTNINLYEYGLDLQLPIYGMLLKQSLAFKDLELAALFLQSLSAGNNASARYEDLEAHYAKTIQYKGLFTFDKPVLKVIAGEVDGVSPITERLFTRNDTISGTYKNRELNEQYIKTATKYVYSTLKGILNMEFPVLYKKIGNEDTRQFSAYKDISYIKYTDRDFGIWSDEDEEE